METDEQVWPSSLGPHEAGEVSQSRSGPSFISPEKAEGRMKMSEIWIIMMLAQLRMFTKS